MAGSPVLPNAGWRDPNLIQVVARPDNVPLKRKKKNLQDFLPSPPRSSPRPHLVAVSDVQRSIHASCFLQGRPEKTGAQLLISSFPGSTESSSVI